MRIVYISTSPIPSLEANAIQVVKMCSALAKVCKEVQLFGHKGDLMVEDVYQFYKVSPNFRLQQIQIPTLRKLRRIVYAWKVWRILRKQKEAFTLFGRDYYLMGLYARFRLLNVPLWLEIHQPPVSSLHFRLQRWIFESPSFEKLIVISEALKKEYERLFGEKVKGKILVAHDGADANQLPESLRQGRTYTQESPVLKIGYIGSFYPGKGMEMVADLVPRLPEYEFHVVGGSPEEVSQWQNQIPGNNIRFHGFVNPGRIYEFMSKFDVVLAPFQESVLVGDQRVDIAKWMSPLKVFEYMSGGSAMVCTDLPVLREVLTDGENALLAEAGNPEDWVRQIQKLASNASLRQKIGQKAQSDFFSSYTWHKRVNNILEFQTN